MRLTSRLSTAGRLLLMILLCPALAAHASPAAPAKDQRALQREQFQVAWEAARHAPDSVWQPLAAGLESYPLYPYLPLASIERRMTGVSRKQVDQFLADWPGSLPARTLRNDFLRELARRKDWKSFVDLYTGTGPAIDLKCDALHARFALHRPVDFERDVKPIWLAAQPLPKACDELTDWARAHHKLRPRLVWQRIELATRARQASLVDGLASLLDRNERHAAERIADAIRDPATALKHAANWPDTSRARMAAITALERLAPRDSDAVEAHWSKLGRHFHFSSEQRDHILHVIALYRAADFAPDAAQRLARLPASAVNDTIREWRVRVALANQDWKQALTALDALSPDQRDDVHWRYLRGRVLATLGQKNAAAAALSAIADQANYYGFLAADWLGRPYTICAEQFGDDPAVDQALRQNPDLNRAFEFFAINALPQARREWNFALAKLSAAQRRAAANLAAGMGWHDRAVYAFNHGDDMRLYDLRFPLVRRNQIVQQAKSIGLDPAWAYAIIRAESAWTTDAHSGADAYGLMQLLPATARGLAKTANQPYAGAADLLDPQVNINLGVHYLSDMAIRYDGSPWLASAAYNAGPDPVSDWINARDTLAPDFFIETIPYKETREYVARVLAFSVIYDWRLHGKVVPLASRLPRVGQPYAAPAADAPRKAVVCPAQATAATPPAPPATTK